jgi:putative ABC transport system substrate-binding protein
VAVIAAIGPLPVALAAKAATGIIPVVFGISEDPVQFGLVASLSRPGGNVTGVTSLNAEVAPKRLEILRQFLPGGATIALLVNPTNPATEYQLRDLQAAGRTLGMDDLHVLRASIERDFDAAFASLAQLRAGGLLIVTDGLFVTRSEQLAALALRYGVPAIFQYHEFAAAGGLMSYGGNIAETYRKCGAYVGRILKGEKPAALPVQQTAKLDLVINLKTAKTLGLTVPPSLLAIADEVIE